MCLLECSCHGLLETELLSILGDEDNLNPPDSEDKDSSEKGMISRASTLFYIPVHFVESVTNCGLRRQCLACTNYTKVVHCKLAITGRFVMSPAPSIRFCAIPSYCLFHSHAHVISVNAVGKNQNQ